MATPPIVVGHRGFGANTRDNNDVIENTLMSVAAAAACGVTWVEVDARMTIDGTFILWHDDEITYKSHDSNIESSNIADITVDKLNFILQNYEIFRKSEASDVYTWRKKQCPSPESMPVTKLDELLNNCAFYGLLGINVELKIPQHKESDLDYIICVCEHFLERIQSVRSQDLNIVLSSFSEAACAELVRQGARWVMLLRKHDTLASALACADQIGAHGVVVHVSMLCEQTQSEGCNVWCYGGLSSLASHCIIDIAP